MSAPPATAKAPLTVRLRGRDVPVVLPKWGDPRLKSAAVLLTVQVLGQTVLGFKLSIAQILVSLGAAAAIELTVVFVREEKLVWPAGAFLTGNSVALLLRATGTRHGDWWSLHGIQWFLLAIVVAFASKYLIHTPGRRHLFNPSNVGLVWVLLVVGLTGVFPQYLYWGPLEAPVIVTVLVLVGGAVWVLRPIGMLPMAASYLGALGVTVAVIAALGGSFFAIWSPVEVTGAYYWAMIVVSPETMIFVFFMMSDPATAPKSRNGRVIYGVATALISAGLLSFQSTEFGVKLAILASLTVTCAAVPFIERRVARQPIDVSRWRAAITRPAIAAAAIVAIAAPINTASLANDPQLILIEQGVSGIRNPQ